MSSRPPSATRPQELETTYLNLTNSARHLQYNWGYAVFILENNAW